MILSARTKFTIRHKPLKNAAKKLKIHILKVINTNIRIWHLTENCLSGSVVLSVDEFILLHNYIFIKNRLGYVRTQTVF